MVKDIKHDIPLVSVIVPCHNRHLMLEECIYSISNQTYPNIEVIVVDDASVEDICEVVLKAEVHYPISFQYIRSNDNIGPGHARELGRQRASGEYICYQDSDDLWHPEKIEYQVKCLQENKHAGMCYCSSLQFSTLPLAGNEPYRKYSNASFSEFLPMLLVLRQRPWGTGACMWTRSATDRIGPWFCGWTWEDMEYDCRAGCHDIKIVHLNQSLCYYRSSPVNNSQLRQLDLTSLLKNTTAAIIQIGHQLEDNGKLFNREISIAYAWLVYDHAISLGKIGELDNSDILLASLKDKRYFGYMVRRLSTLTRLLLKFSKSRFLIWLFGRSVKYLRGNNGYVSDK